MTQLILDVGGYEVELPESQKGGYVAEKRPLSTDVEMITGRIVRELRGNVWYLSYQYGFFDETMKNAVIAACEKGRGASISCAFLAPDSDELQYSDFIVMEAPRPKFMWSRDGSPLWADFSLELREVKPSD